MNKGNHPSPIIVIGGTFILFAVAVGIFMPNRVRSGPSRKNGIINNLRQLDGAVQQWAMEHGRTGAVLVTREDITPYLKRPSNPEGWVKSVVGEKYTLKTITNSPEAELPRKLWEWPKGTVIRLGSTGGAEILPPDSRISDRIMGFGILGVVAWALGCFYWAFRMSRGRKTGPGVFDARLPWNPINLCLRPSLLTDEGLRARKWIFVCFLGVALCLAVALVFGGAFKTS